MIGTLFQQAVPDFADLGPSTYNLYPADVELKITSKTKAIIPNGPNSRLGSLTVSGRAVRAFSCVL